MALYDKSNGLVYTGVTDNQGQITGITVITTTYYKTTSDPSNITTDDRGPFTILVTSGAKSKSQSVNLTGDINLGITLN